MTCICTNEKASNCTAECQGCENGATTVPHGWSGKCADGCNSCSCFNGAMTSTLMACQNSPNPQPSEASGTQRDWLVLLASAMATASALWA
eukprot:CAMPEP_0114544850 /NCGR_PEP_ID=MMETSP0114-20121206/3091_1 /TAXON_ID=31324 /ORGANISM="Goniomonas sp, Strain m" /LENGTH=90 /DNA_ID=CAMNT_0001729247 /DNA_START=264 /DNA_END=536 /DNA_ORIENTATION=-